MSRIPYINCLLGAAIVFVSLFLVAHKRHAVDETLLPPPTPIRSGLPPSLFKTELDLSFDGPLSLAFIAYHLELPDLRSELIFYGKNKRPDACNNTTSVHIGLKNMPATKSVKIGEKIYLVYDRFTSSEERQRLQVQGPLWNEPSHSFSKGRYLFSPKNEKTALWIELSDPTFERGIEKVTVAVSMLDEKGAVVNTPHPLAKFLLASHKNSTTRFSFDLDGQRVDSTLLVRQRARWFGKDLFLEKHGGDDFPEAADKQRIDFLGEKNRYSCFVAENDTLIWEKGRWISSSNTEGYPLLVVKRIDKRTMVFEAWDAEGRGKVCLNLIRSKQGRAPPPINEIFRFVGAKTWAQFIIECQGERKIVKTGDWLLFKEGKWEKLTTETQIDDYVNQTTIGPLLVLDKMEKEQGRQVLLGHLFDSTRTEISEVKLPAETSFFARPTPYALPPRLSGKALVQEGGSELIPKENRN